jgi:hypothetical protein
MSESETPSHDRDPSAPKTIDRKLLLWMLVVGVGLVLLVALNMN